MFIHKFSCQIAALLKAVMVLSLMISAQLQAAPLYSFAGTTPDAKEESKSEVRLSVLEWSSPDQEGAVIEAFQQWKQSQDAGIFEQFLKGQPTMGYVFTGEATGYSVKYAHENINGSMSLLIVPGLKSKNRYMWDPASPVGASPFTLLEVTLEEEGEEEVGRVKTSLDGEIELTSQGLSLSEEGDYSIFAELKDATPYYLKE